MKIHFIVSLTKSITRWNFNHNFCHFGEIKNNRTQSNNREHCIEKLKVMVAQAYIVPKERNMYEGISKGAKIERKIEKRARGVVKSARRSNNVRDFDD